MIDIQLEINGERLILGEKLNIPLLKEHEIKKSGFFMKLMIKKFIGNSKNDEIYWAKNCLIGCFNTFGLAPNTDSKEGTFNMYGTSAFLLYSNKILSKVVFQIIGNKFYSKALYNFFVSKASEKFGEPLKDRKWELDDSILWCDHSTSSSSQFYWILKEKSHSNFL